MKTAHVMTVISAAAFAIAAHAGPPNAAPRLQSVEAPADVPSVPGDAPAAPPGASPDNAESTPSGTPVHDFAIVHSASTQSGYTVDVQAGRFHCAQGQRRVLLHSDQQFFAIGCGEIHDGVLDVHLESGGEYVLTAPGQDSPGQPDTQGN